MPIVGTPRVFQKKFAFTVEIERVAHAGFKSQSEIKAEVATVEQWEGGAIIPDKTPGRVTVSDVTLERGAANKDSDLYDWWLETVKMTANAGLPTPGYKRDVDTIQRDRDATVLRTWALAGAWPRVFIAGAWDNEADENVIESMTLALDTFEKREGSQ